MRAGALLCRDLFARCPGRNSGVRVRPAEAWRSRDRRECWVSHSDAQQQLLSATVLHW